MGSIGRVDDRPSSIMLVFREDVRVIVVRGAEEIGVVDRKKKGACGCSNTQHAQCSEERR
jgi:hypothetical protein